MTNDRALSTGVLARLMTCLLVALGMFLSAGTTSANAATFTYDASTAERADVHEIRVAEAGPVQGSEAGEGSGSRCAETRAASTTLTDTAVATNTAHVVSGSRPAPGKGEPNSIREQIRPDGTRSVTYYDQAGEPFSREDYGQQRGHGQMDPSTPHEHQTCFNDLGQPIGK